VHLVPVPTPTQEFLSRDWVCVSCDGIIPKGVTKVPQDVRWVPGKRSWRHRVCPMGLEAMVVGQAAGVPSPPTPPTPAAEQSRAAGVAAELRARARVQAGRQEIFGDSVRLQVLDPPAGFEYVTITGYLKPLERGQVRTKADVERLVQALGLDLVEP
jgi:hypothetical protein